MSIDTTWLFGLGGVKVVGVDLDADDMPMLAWSPAMGRPDAVRGVVRARRARTPGVSPGPGPAAGRAAYRAAVEQATLAMPKPGV